MWCIFTFSITLAGHIVIDTGRDGKKSHNITLMHSYVMIFKIMWLSMFYCSNVVNLSRKSSEHLRTSLFEFHLELWKEDISMSLKRFIRIFYHNVIEFLNPNFHSWICDVSHPIWMLSQTGMSAWCSSCDVIKWVTSQRSADCRDDWVGRPCRQR